MNGRPFVAASLVSVFATAACAQSRSLGVSPENLRATLAQLAHDSLRGRISGTRAVSAVASQIVKEVATAGLRPAGDKGKFQQDVPLVRVQLDSAATQLSSKGYTFTYGIDYQPLVGVAGLPFPRLVSANEWLFGGRLGSNERADSSAVLGKAVIMLPRLRANGQPDYQVWHSIEHVAPYLNSSAILVISQELMPPSVRRAMERAYIDLKTREPRRKLPPVFAISWATASLIMGVAPDAAPIAVIPKDGHLAGNWRIPQNFVHVRADVSETALKDGTQNIVAVLDGSDPRLRGEYVVITARLDQADREAEGGETAGAWPLTPDSVRSGANAVTGATALLELARRMVAASERPKRSIVFLWTVAGEDEGKGAKWFLEHSQIPRDRIVANLDIDRIGRGGGPDDLHVTGARRLSSQLGDIVDEASRTAGFSLDRTYDASGHSARYNCLGDHRHFGLNGIPNVFVTTGMDADSHTSADKIDTIDFAKLARVTEFIGALAIDIANRPARPVIDKQKPDPDKPCVQ
jgi:hypothetical protein